MDVYVGKPGFMEYLCFVLKYKSLVDFPYTVELQWLEHLWDHENLFETRVVRANEV